MKLGFLDSNNSEEIKNHIVKLANSLAKSVNSIKHTFTEKQLENLSDALAVAETLKMNFAKMDGEEIKGSTKRFSKLVKAVFQEDVSPSDLRTEIKKNQGNLVKPVEPRSEGEGKRLGDTYKDMPSNVYQDKHCSAIPEALVAERIMRDLYDNFYHTAQDAYDGYCQTNGAYVYASARQKVRLAQLLRFYGFLIKADQWEKEADDNYKEWKKQHEDYGKGERNPEDRLISHAGKKSSTEYCGKCKKSTKHVVHASKNACTCNACGTKKKIVKRNATSKEAQEWISNKISKLVDEGKDRDQAVAIAHSMARQKGFDVPKKGQYDPRMTLEEGGYADQPDTPTATELVKTGMYNYACEGCGYEEQHDEENGEYNCPKCGAMLKYSDMQKYGEDPARIEEHGKIPSPVEGLPGNSPTESLHDDMSSTLNESYDPGKGKSDTTITNTPERYRTMRLNVEAVAKIDEEFAKHMNKVGMKSVTSEFILKRFAAAPWNLYEGLDPNDPEFQAKFRERMDAWQEGKKKYDEKQHQEYEKQFEGMSPYERKEKEEEMTRQKLQEIITRLSQPERETDPSAPWASDLERDIDVEGQTY